MENETTATQNVAEKLTLANLPDIIREKIKKITPEGDTQADRDLGTHFSFPLRGIARVLSKETKVTAEIVDRNVSTTGYDVGDGGPGIYSGSGEVSHNLWVDFIISDPQNKNPLSVRFNGPDQMRLIPSIKDPDKNNSLFKQKWSIEGASSNVRFGNQKGNDVVSDYDRHNALKALTKLLDQRVNNQKSTLNSVQRQHVSEIIGFAQIYLDRVKQEEGETPVVVETLVNEIETVNAPERPGGPESDRACTLLVGQNGEKLVLPTVPKNRRSQETRLSQLGKPLQKAVIDTNNPLPQPIEDSIVNNGEWSVINTGTLITRERHTGNGSLIDADTARFSLETVPDPAGLYAVYVPQSRDHSQVKAVLIPISCEVDGIRYIGNHPFEIERAADLGLISLPDTPKERRDEIIRITGLVKTNWFTTSSVRELQPIESIPVILPTQPEMNVPIESAPAESKEIKSEPSNRAAKLENVMVRISETQAKLDKVVDFGEKQKLINTTVEELRKMLHETKDAGDRKDIALQIFCLGYDGYTALAGPRGVFSTFSEITPDSLRVYIGKINAADRQVNPELGLWVDSQKKKLEVSPRIYEYIENKLRGDESYEILIDDSNRAPYERQIFSALLDYPDIDLSQLSPVDVLDAIDPNNRADDEDPNRQYTQALKNLLSKAPRVVISEHPAKVSPTTTTKKDDYILP